MKQWLGEYFHHRQWIRRGFSDRRASWADLVTLLSQWNSVWICGGVWDRPWGSDHRYRLLRDGCAGRCRSPLGPIDSEGNQHPWCVDYQLDRRSNHPPASHEK